MFLLTKKILKRVHHKINNIRISMIRRLLKGGKIPKGLTITQQAFIEWNSERLNISLNESKQRYLDSWSTLYGGHGGSVFKMNGAILDKLYKVFADSNDNEIFEVYSLHAHRHFLRMLSYPERLWADNDPVIREIGDEDNITLIDFGCGLAHSSRMLTRYLKNKGCNVKLILADIPTIRKDFLIWLCKKEGVDMRFIDCTKDVPIPDLPRCNVCFATEFFEHVSQPLLYFDKFNESLVNNGLLITNISNHEDEFLHISPNLEQLRNSIQELNYEEISPYTIFKKTFD